MPENIQALLASGRLERIGIMKTLQAFLLKDARQHLYSAVLLQKSDDVNGAFQLAYDSTRKSCAALLAHHGLRVTSRGGHFALINCARELSLSIGQLYSEINDLRQLRNAIEYPLDVDRSPSNDRLSYSIALAERVLTLVSAEVAS
jgi:uncharacterized protein (UPF0332 family)